MGTLVPQQQKVLGAIKEAAALANSVPALRATVQSLADEVQKLKDAALGKIEVQDD